MTSEWLQIRHKTQVSDTFEVGKLYFKIDSYLPDFRDSVIFPYISLYTQAAAYTTYVKSAARRALKNTSKRRLLSLGSLWYDTLASVISLIDVTIRAISTLLNELGFLLRFLVSFGFVVSKHRQGGLICLIMRRISFPKNSRTKTW